MLIHFWKRCRGEKTTAHRILWLSTDRPPHVSHSSFVLPQEAKNPLNKPKKCWKGSKPSGSHQVHMVCMRFGLTAKRAVDERYWVQGVRRRMCLLILLDTHAEFVKVWPFLREICCYTDLVQFATQAGQQSALHSSVFVCIGMGVCKCPPMPGWTPNLWIKQSPHISIVTRTLESHSLIRSVGFVLIFGSLKAFIA